MPSQPTGEEGGGGEPLHMAVSLFLHAESLPQPNFVPLPRGLQTGELPCEMDSIAGENSDIMLTLVTFSPNSSRSCCAYAMRFSFQSFARSLFSYSSIDILCCRHLSARPSPFTLPQPADSFESKERLVGNTAQYTVHP